MTTSEYIYRVKKKKKGCDGTHTCATLGFIDEVTSVSVLATRDVTVASIRRRVPWTTPRVICQLNLPFTKMT